MRENFENYVRAFIACKSLPDDWTTKVQELFLDVMREYVANMCDGADKEKISTVIFLLEDSKCAYITQSSQEALRDKALEMIRG